MHCSRYPCMGTYQSPISGETSLMRRILSLDECLIILATHDRSRHYEVLTFDDGYRDNLSVASDPRAEQRAIYIPADVPARSMQSWWLV